MSGGGFPVGNCRPRYKVIAVRLALLIFATTVVAEEPLVLAARRVMPSVVSLATEKLRRRRSKGTLRRYSVRGVGSGFVIDTLGHILTCDHVIADYQTVTVRFSDGRTVAADQVRVLGRDPVTDLAVLKVEGVRGLIPIEWADSDRLELGQSVAAVGSPFGLDGSFSSGVVSGLSRWGLPKRSGPDFQDFIQTDALINPGNSGGPLIDARGLVVGVSSFIRTESGGHTGIGFAIPSNLARDVARMLIASGFVRRGFSGINAQELTGPLREALAYSDSGGVLIAALAAGGPAIKAGLRPGDIIVELNGRRVTDVRWFQNTITGYPPGSEVRLVFIRGGREAAVSFVLGAWPGVSPEPQPQLQPVLWLGLGVRDLEETDRARTGLAAGVVVSALEPGAPAADAGLVVGDVIVEINLTPVRSRADFLRIRRSLAGSDRPLAMRVFRGRSAFYTAVEP